MFKSATRTLLRSNLHKNGKLFGLRFPQNYQRVVSRTIFMRGPFEVYNVKPTLTRRVLNLIPAPIKAFGVIAGSAAVVFFIATPLIIIAGPPIALCLWWYGRRWRRLQSDLYRQRWNNMGTYHLAFQEDPDIGGRRLPPIARSRIIKALENNEQGIAAQLGYSADQDLPQFKFTSVESIHQDFKGSSQGFQEEMEVCSYGLLQSGSNYTRQERVANIVLVSQRNTTRRRSGTTTMMDNDSIGGQDSKTKMRIELTTIGYNSQTYVLNSGGDSEEDVIIEVKGR